MNRRQCVAAMMLTAVGCRSRFKEAAVIETIDWPQRISERAAQQVPTTHVITFDPALAYLIGQLIYGLIRYCLAAQIRRQHSTNIRRPMRSPSISTLPTRWPRSRRRRRPRSKT